jgi:hypothetical protein
MDLQFPFTYEEYILNEKVYVKFTHIDTNLSGVCNINMNGLYIVSVNDKLYIIYKKDNLEYYYNSWIDNNIQYVSYVNNFNKHGVKIDASITNLFDLINEKTKEYILQNSALILDNYKTTVCKLYTTTIDLILVKQELDKLNIQLATKCNSLYSLNIDYAYKMNNIIYFEGDDDEDENINNIYICLYYKQMCVSSIKYLIVNNTIIITSKTKEEYEGNKFNKLLRATTMIIIKSLNILYIHSGAINPISALLLFTMFENTKYNEKFNAYINRNNIDITKLNKKELYQVFENYLGKISGFISMTSQVTDNNIKRAYDIFNSIIQQLPCELPGQFGGNPNYIINKCNKYMYKINNKYSDIYFDKILEWNTLYLFHTINQ